MNRDEIDLRIIALRNRQRESSCLRKEWTLIESEIKDLQRMKERIKDPAQIRGSKNYER